MTTRIPLDHTKPITELENPEFFDVGINSLCDAGCPWCYTSADTHGRNFRDPVGKIEGLWGNMEPSLRPFQVAIGGSGEATQHPAFPAVLEKFHSLGIMPNYTTNGRWWSKPRVLESTAQFCGGVAISCHPHMDKEWKKAIQVYQATKILVNLHIIIGNRASSERFTRIYEEFEGYISHFVLLPLMPVGRASKAAAPDTDALKLHLANKDLTKIAFGSNFYEWLKTERDLIPAMLYPPEIMSKYILLDDPVTVYDDSFKMGLRKVVKDWEKGLGPIPLKA